MAFQDTVRHYAKALAEMGYVSYCFDFNGGCVIKGKSDGKTTEMSALTASKLNHKISKLILFYPAFCIPDDARAGKMIMAKFDPNHIPDRIKCGPMKLGKCYVEDVIALDPYEEIKGFLGDILLIHGTKDSIVNISYVKKAYDTYLKVSKENNLSRNVFFHTIKDGKHGFSKKHDKIAIEYLKQFLL